MANSNNDKRSQFVNSLKVNTSTQSNANKRSQFSSNNQSNSSGNKADAPSRQRSLTTGRGNER